jgi:hypothetical protein
MYFDLIDDVKAGSCPGGAGPGQVTSCDLCDFCFEGHDRFARLDPACPNDRARDTVQRISDRCLSVFWTSLPRRDLSPRIRPHHRFANRHLKPNAPSRLCPFRPFFAHSTRLPVQILPRCLTLSPPPPYHTPDYCHTKRRHRQERPQRRSRDHLHSKRHLTWLPWIPHVCRPTYSRLDILDK